MMAEPSFCLCKCSKFEGIHPYPVGYGNNGSIKKLDLYMSSRCQASYLFDGLGVTLSR